MRIGHGYDVHRFANERPLILGGVKIREYDGLLGHSDADVLLHAVADALLGAAALRDIGYHFPDTDSSFKNVDSRILLRKVVKLLKDKNFFVVNIDATVIAQAPKLSPYIEEMRKNIAVDLDISLDSVNVKATTEEHLGFTGELKGISSHCVCLIDNCG